MATEESLSQILEAAGRGDRSAAERLLAAVYDELRRLAQGMLRRESPDISIQATMLVNDVWLSLFGADEGKPGFENRRHFFGAAARAMRRVLVDHARSRHAERRGGRNVHVTFVDHVIGETRDVAVLDLHDAIEELEVAAPEVARVVELRYFAGLSLEETAAALERSPATIKREWSYARAWLHDRIDRAGTA